MNLAQKTEVIEAYSEKAISTAQYPEKGKNLLYPALGLAGETGEVCEKVKKILRDKGGVVDKETRNALLKELGDIMWYINACTVEAQLDFRSIFFRAQEEHFNNWKGGDCEVSLASPLDVLASSALSMHRLAGKVTSEMENIHWGISSSNPASTLERSRCSIRNNMISILLHHQTCCILLDSGIVEVMAMNIEKLFSRKERGKIKGDGDDR